MPLLLRDITHMGLDAYKSLRIVSCPTNKAFILIKHGVVVSFLSSVVHCAALTSVASRRSLSAAANSSRPNIVSHQVSVISCLLDQVSGRKLWKRGAGKPRLKFQLRMIMQIVKAPMQRYLKSWISAPLFGNYPHHCSRIIWTKFERTGQLHRLLARFFIKRQLLLKTMQFAMSSFSY